jgi:Origin recognition complex (ORC) subunit 3 N-terminus
MLPFQKSVPAIKKRTQVTTVAVYDLSVLEAWYDRATSGNSEPFKIVVVIPTIEVCDSTVLQHFFHICRCCLHVLSRLVRTLKGLSQPSNPSNSPHLCAWDVNLGKYSSDNASTFISRQP